MNHALHGLLINNQRLLLNQGFQSDVSPSDSNASKGVTKGYQS